MMGGVVIGTTLATMAAIGAGQVASASHLMGTCATTATFTASGTCTVLAGEVINFGLKGGDGGLGGTGGAGGNGGPVLVPFVLGGIGGAGGLEGGRGAGAQIIGSYTNSTGATVTLTFDIGVKGIDGSAGSAGSNGSAGDPASNGQDGTDGGNGTTGTETVLRIDSSVIAAAEGGAGGTGGKGGKGGTGASGSTPGLNGAAGENGLKGANGSYAPSPLPDSWMYNDSDLSDPRVDFWQDEHEEPTTTTEPVTTTAPLQLPATGSDTGSTVWVTLLVLASGASLVVVARRRVVR